MCRHLVNAKSSLIPIQEFGKPSKSGAQLRKAGWLSGMVAIPG